MGVIEFRTGDAALSWEGKSDEIFCCLEGKIEVEYEGPNGAKGAREAGTHGLLFLPRGYRYSLKAAGPSAKAVFCKKA